MTDLESFYVAAYPRLVSHVALLTGNVADAEELAQDAFVRLVPRWDKVSTYDDPESWLRQVAVRLAVSRWRRGRVAAAGLLKLRPRGFVDGPTGYDIDVLQALAALPAGQRHALVLHHVADIPVEEVARLLGLAEGTVKSRLSRGRAALAAALAQEAIHE